MRKSVFAGALVATAALAAPAFANDSVVKCIEDENNWCMQQHDYNAPVILLLIRSIRRTSAA